MRRASDRPYGFLEVSPERYSKQRGATGQFIDGAVKYKRDWQSHEHTIFAVVRDPVERFISAIGQATGGLGSDSRSEFAHMLSKECLDDLDGDALHADGGGYIVCDYV